MKVDAKPWKIEFEKFSCDEFLTFPWHVYASIYLYILSFTPAPLESYKSPFDSCIEFTFDGENVIYEQTYGNITPWCVFESYMIPYTLLSDECACSNLCDICWVWCIRILMKLLEG